MGSLRGWRLGIYRVCFFFCLKFRGTLLGVLIIRTTAFGGLYWGPLFRGTTIFSFLLLLLLLLWLVMVTSPWQNSGNVGENRYCNRQGHTCGFDRERQGDPLPLKAR